LSRDEQEIDMRYGALFPYAGNRPLQEYFLGANDVGSAVAGYPAASYAGPGSAPTFMPNGVIVPGFDNYWGGVEFQYCFFNSTVAAWAPVSIKPTLTSGRYLFTAAALANTANQSRPVGIAIAQMAAGQWGWVAVSGLLPVLSGASIATDTPLGITGAGQLGASSAGKEIENLVGVLPATTTVLKNCLVTANSPVVSITGNNTIDGWFIGVAISGTGIPANAVIQTLDPDGKRFSLSTGPGVAGAALNATASGGVSLTGTYNDGTNFYNVVQANRPFAQGRIT
jgi:hypothetical protein